MSRAPTPVADQSSERRGRPGPLKREHASSQSAIQPFRQSGIQPFSQSGNQAFSHSAIQPFRQSGIQPFRHSGNHVKPYALTIDTVRAARR
ncbi:MAG: hypothetical protein EXR75_12700 [Myxococcales bacterium]|nr:hypothetical protein [Myxococcales bacterium]